MKELNNPKNLNVEGLTERIKTQGFEMVYTWLEDAYEDGFIDFIIIFPGECTAKTIDNKEAVFILKNLFCKTIETRSEGGYICSWQEGHGKGSLGKDIMPKNDDWHHIFLMGKIIDGKKFIDIGVDSCINHSNLNTHDFIYFKRIHCICYSRYSSSYLVKYNFHSK